MIHISSSKLPQGIVEVIAMPKEHISKQFDTDIKAIRTHVLQMGALVEAQIIHAIDALATGNTELADKVIANDFRVNALELTIDELCSHLIVRRQPTAGDLHFAIMIAKTVTDLERMGDEAKKVARMAKMIYERNSLTMPRFTEIRHMGNLVLETLRKSLEAFSKLEGSTPGQLARQDIEVENEFRSVLRHLISYMIEDPRTISVAIELLFAAKAIERMGDHARRLAQAYQGGRDAILSTDQVPVQRRVSPLEEPVPVAAGIDRTSSVSFG